MSCSTSAAKSCIPLTKGIGGLPYFGFYFPTARTCWVQSCVSFGFCLPAERSSPPSQHREAPVLDSDQDVEVLESGNNKIGYKHKKEVVRGTYYHGAHQRWWKTYLHLNRSGILLQWKNKRTTPYRSSICHCINTYRETEFLLDNTSSNFY